MSEALPARGYDFHCHVDLLPAPAAFIDACDRQRLVTIAVTTTPKAWPQNRQWTSNSRYVHAAAGLHPELAGARHGEIGLLESIMKETTFVGEVGLDGRAEHRQTWAAQIEVFTRVLEQADRLGGRVISVHSRAAATEALRCIQDRTRPGRVMPILHWFSGSFAAADRAVALGCYFSINPNSLENESGALLARRLPPDRLLTETDAPFATQGTPDIETARKTLRRLSELHGVSVARMGAHIAANATRVFAFAGISASLEPAD